MTVQCCRHSQWAMGCIVERRHRQMIRLRLFLCPLYPLIYSKGDTAVESMASSAHGARSVLQPYWEK